MAGMCAAKALEQHRCKRVNETLPACFHSYRLNTILTQILLSRGFDAYMPVVFLSKCIIRVNAEFARVTIYLHIKPCC
jgi:hypothetical protein